MIDKLWFNDNIAIGVTKLRLDTWNNEKYIIPIDTDFEWEFLATDNSGETSKYEFAENWTIITDVIFIQDPTEIAIQNAYFKREIDGIRFYRAMRANLVKMMLTQVLTTEDVDLIDRKVEKAIGKMITGDWISTKYRVEEAIVEGAFTQEYKDDLLMKINTYIAENYDF